MSRLILVRRAVATALLAIFDPAGGGARAAELSDNLAAVTSGTESVTATRWLAAAFTTEAAATHELSAVTLLLAGTSGGSAALDLYTDAGLEPGSLVATLTSPAGYPEAPEPTTFTADDVSLDPNMTYWVVLRAIDGNFDWAWTTDDTGSGAGFLPDWDVSEDAGNAWWTHAIYPLQLRVTVDTTPPIVDCNDNDVADQIDVESGTSADCNANGKPDECDIASDTAADCNGNGSPDSCDVARGESADANANGVPDTCEPVFLRSDSNCDGEVSISDATWTLNYLFVGGPTPCCGDAADVNDDGEVDISDAVRALLFLFRDGPRPPLPGPFLPCGIDPSGDPIDESLPCEYPPDACLEAP